MLADLFVMPKFPTAVQTHEPKTKVVPALIAGTLKLKEAIEFFR